MLKHGKINPFFFSEETESHFCLNSIYDDIVIYCNKIKDKIVFNYLFLILLPRLSVEYLPLFVLSLSVALPQ
jgi:hypothetical protein